MTHPVFAADFHAENEYVGLRLLTMDDAPSLQELYEHPLSLTKAEELVRSLLAAWRQGECVPLAVVSTDDGMCRGIIEFRCEGQDTVQIGYRIMPAWQNRHYGTEAVYLLTHYLCERTGIRRIRALAEKDNVWSLRLLRHTGFEKVSETESAEEYVYCGKEKAERKLPVIPDGRKMICAAGGCFWGTERIFQMLDGVTQTECGYANGHTEDPRYEDVCNRETGYREAVLITYDPEKVSLRKLMKAFFLCVDPTVANRQGNDIGSQYQTGIYYLQEEDREELEEIFSREKQKYDVFAVELEPLHSYWTAEEYHQKYLDKNPGGYCHITRAELDEVRKLNEEPL